MSDKDIVERAVDPITGVGNWIPQDICEEAEWIASRLCLADADNAKEIKSVLRVHLHSRQEKAEAELESLRAKHLLAIDSLHNTIADRDREIAGLREALGWQPMELAPRDRRILLDVSYLYPGDEHPTECYVVGQFDGGNPEYCWLTDDASMRHDAPIGWMGIPKTAIARADDSSLGEDRK